MNNEHATPDVRAFLELWERTFNSHKWQDLVALYADDALLFGTSSPALYIGAEQLRTYFRGTASVRFDTWSSMSLAAEVALVVGEYVFSEDREGEPLVTPARFTFVLRRHLGAWKIRHHHSSASPSEKGSPT
ncbi:nuclear transport factor 2 family protein (plasmid) [Bradyrhizobium sp. 62B]|uniref:nuclear transport factor 2 family protein n=1 Tax=Bradyrhizobium sp. 62B TaxID=2898442 RepID=UPI0025582053|nr:nuclear transport factor 2 family protein [Bradyrhizobium sp. 62B]